tara:strand:+ start:1081 stop:1239 length:159 start_codon:yes stop_codon:yes gene_type:complete
MDNPAGPPAVAHVVKPRPSRSPNASGGKFVRNASNSLESFVFRIINAFGNLD